MNLVLLAISELKFLTSLPGNCWTLCHHHRAFITIVDWFIEVDNFWANRYRNFNLSRLESTVQRAYYVSQRRLSKHIVLWRISLKHMKFWLGQHERRISILWLNWRLNQVRLKNDVTNMISLSKNMTLRKWLVQLPRFAMNQMINQTNAHLRIKTSR